MKKLSVAVVVGGLLTMSGGAWAVDPGPSVPPANPDNQSINCEGAANPATGAKNFGMVLVYNRENNVHDDYPTFGQFVAADTQGTGGTVDGRRSATLADFFSRCDIGPE